MKDASFTLKDTTEFLMQAQLAAQGLDTRGGGNVSGGPGMNYTFR